MPFQSEEAAPRASERDPLLPARQPSLANNDESHELPSGFLWIEAALFANVFLAGFDSTVTASTYAVISSEFMASNTASWITTSYLLTSTAIQPLYGRFSDIFGRRICVLVATAAFGIGCLGCGIARDIVILDIMRAVTGIGGGGLMTMATIINSDIVPQRQRGAYQAVQNILIGLGSIFGASFGGFIADSIGWRYCFLLQVPVSIGAFFVGFQLIGDSRTRKASDAAEEDAPEVMRKGAWDRVDVAGALCMVGWLSLQTAALSMGSNSLDWKDPNILACFVGSLVLLGLFIRIEATTSAAPVMPLKVLQRLDRVALLVANIALGSAAYGFLFLMPLFFQAVLLDPPSIAGLRLVAPAMSTPVGSLITAYLMARGDYLNCLTRLGLVALFVSACLVWTLEMVEPHWKYSLYLVLGSLGQGIVFPSSLFAFIRAFDFEDHAVATSLVYLSRSMGSVWGIAAVSTIIQSLLTSKLSAALEGLPDSAEIIGRLKHSVEAIRALDAETRARAQRAYYESCGAGAKLLVLISLVAVLASFFVASPRQRGIK